METTFITIHDLTPEATVLYSSDSIVDILGYQPEEVVHQSCWAYFHPAELPHALARYGKGVEMDKAAVLSYCRMRHKDGSWVGCEVVFTIVHDCMVGCTSIYRRGINSQNRAAEAPIVRRLFSASPRDPRYHMLSHLSSKFTTPAKPSMNEPRAALFLNRYTRTLTIMYATNGLADVLDIPGDELRGKSFYYCIREDCLGDAIRCLENAKANDSIAYMRFWYRDPRIETALPLQQDTPASNDADLSRHSSDDDHEMGGVALQSSTEHTSPNNTRHASSTETTSPHLQDRRLSRARSTTPRASPAGSSHPSNPQTTHEAIFGSTHAQPDSASPLSDSGRSAASSSYRSERHLELEAVISCTSDGMVVCLRKARPFPPDFVQRTAAAARHAPAFAVPWSLGPLSEPVDHFSPNIPPLASSATPDGITPPVLSTEPAALPAETAEYMASIRDCAVFAWALTGINGNIADHGQGTPSGEAQPPNGMPIWDPQHAPAVDNPHNLVDVQHAVNSLSSENIAHAKSRANPFGFGDPGLGPR